MVGSDTHVAQEPRAARVEVELGVRRGHGVPQPLDAHLQVPDVDANLRHCATRLDGDLAVGGGELVHRVEEAVDELLPAHAVDVAICADVVHLHALHVRQLVLVAQADDLAQHPLRVRAEKGHVAIVHESPPTEAVKQALAQPVRARDDLLLEVWGLICG